MKTEKEIKKEIELKTSALILYSDSIESLKFNQGYIAALKFVLQNSKEGDAFS